jgi:phosphatidylinositol-bisphosphatase
MGMMGNKGGVSVRIKVFDSYLCFVNSHLAADSSQVERRNQDYQEISRRMGFPPPIGPALGTSSSMKSLRNSIHPANRQGGQDMAGQGSFNGFLGNRNIQRPYSIYDVDHLIWLGDLNYRLTLPNDKVRELIKTSEYDKLLEHDQLGECINSKKSFVGFSEGKIDFSPTYKFDIGTDNYDSSEKKRVPSYCDRILWRSMETEHQLELIEYKSTMELTSSDHKPVSAVFSVPTKTLKMDDYMEVYSSMIRELDKFENEIMPDARISETGLDFGEVRYGNPKERSLVIENIGQVFLQYQFIPKMNETTFCKPWIWVNPPSGVILPGEKARVNFIMLVDNRTAPKLNLGEDKLDDILILHLEKGKDYFVSVSGNYKPTTFAVPLEYLCRLPCPIRSLGEKELLPIENQLSVPQVVWRMISFIYEHGTSVENLFLTPGDKEIMEHISECLDTGDEFDMTILGAELLSDSEEDEDEASNLPPLPKASPLRSDGVHSMSETLIRFLEALTEPLIPPHLYRACLDAAASGKEPTLLVSLFLCFYIILILLLGVGEFTSC